MSISAYCICKRALIEEAGVYTLLPCTHIIHISCYNKLTNKNMCPYCKKKVEKKVSIEQCKKLIDKKKEYKQYYYNMRGVSNKHFDNTINYPIFFLRVPEILREIYISSNSYSKKEKKLSARRFLRLLGCKINFDKNKYNKIKEKNKKIIIIANHHTALDALIITSLFNCGGLAGSFLKGTWIGNIIESFGVVWVNRSKKSNTVKKIKEYLKKKDKLIVFPEGTITNKDTLGQFRSGAFNIGIPILPVLIKYDKYLYVEDSMVQTGLKIMSKSDININVDILDIEYPPFDKKKVNNIRRKMSKKGELLLTNISSKGAKK